MEVKYENSANYLLVTVKGRLDTFTAGDFEQTHLENICQAGKNVIVDCSGLDYISSAGMRVILTLAKKMGHGKFCLCGVAGLVEEVIVMSGFSDIIPVYSGLGDAIAADRL